MAPTTAFIGLGSNLGDRVDALKTAVETLSTLEGSRLIAVSSLYETSPVGVEGGPFINAVVLLETGLEPEALLAALLDMEAAMGRVRGPGRSGSRHIDLDLLLFGSAVMRQANLALPHPRLLERRFVLEPLAEMAPDIEIPPTGVTAAQAAADLRRKDPEQKVKRFGTLGEVRKGLRFEV